MLHLKKIEKHHRKYLKHPYISKVTENKLQNLIKKHSQEQDLKTTNSEDQDEILCMYTMEGNTI